MEFLNRRQYYSFTDEVPPVELIKEILGDTLLTTPIKNDMYGFKVKVFGPEYKKEKEEFLSYTACCSQNSSYKEEQEMYRRLMKEHYKSPSEELMRLAIERKEEADFTRGGKMLFNTQVLSPWLFRFELTDVYWRGNQKTVDMSSSGIGGYERDDKKIIGLSMFAINLANIAKERGIDSSFTGCVHFPNYHTPILEGLSSDQVPFILNLGYGKHRRQTRPIIKKPTLSQVVNFA